MKTLTIALCLFALTSCKKEEPTPVVTTPATNTTITPAQIGESYMVINGGKWNNFKLSMQNKGTPFTYTLTTTNADTLSAYINYPFQKHDTSYAFTFINKIPLSKTSYNIDLSTISLNEQIGYISAISYKYIGSISGTVSVKDKDIWLTFSGTGKIESFNMITPAPINAFNADIKGEIYIRK